MIIYSIDYYQQDQDCTQCGKHSECICGKMIKYHYPYVSKYIYRTQDLAKVASFSDSKPQKQHYAKINGLEKLIINTGNEPFH